MGIAKGWEAAETGGIALNASYFGIEQGLKEGINQEKRSRSWECKLPEAGGRDLQSLPTVQQIKTNKGEEKEKKKGKCEWNCMDKPLEKK